MKTFVAIYLLYFFILFFLQFKSITPCWVAQALDYRVGTVDYDLLVGTDLVVNCTLRNGDITILGKRILPTDLFIEKRDSPELSKYTRMIDDRMIQLKLPNATVNDTGLYLCKAFLSKEAKPVVCGTKVNVGYPPHHVKEFSCTSKNFDSLKCTWNIEKNTVFTKYTLGKNDSDEEQQQLCASNSTTSCEWSREGDDLPYFFIFRHMSFIVTGKNRLGTSVDEFKIDIYSNVIPNPPENLEILNIHPQSATIRWKAPKMKRIVSNTFPLKYQIRISKCSNISDLLIYETNSNITELTIDDLFPNVLYNVSVRCRSEYTEKDQMWSDFTSLVFKTVSDDHDIFPRTAACMMLAVVLFIIIILRFAVWFQYRNSYIQRKSMKLPEDMESPEMITLEMERSHIFVRKSYENNNECSCLAASIKRRTDLSSLSYSASDTDCLIPPSYDSSISETCLQDICNRT